MDTEYIPPSVKMTVSGDIHVSSLTTYTNAGGVHRFLSPGSNIPRSVSETNHDQGYGYWTMLIEMTGDVNNAPMKFTPSSGAFLKDYAVDAATNADAIVVEAKESGALFVAVLRYDATSEVVAHRCADTLREKGIRHLLIENATAKVTSDPLVLASKEAAAALEFSLLAKLPLLGLDKTDPLAHKILTRILPETADVRSELQLAVDEVMQC